MQDPPEANVVKSLPQNVALPIPTEVFVEILKYLKRKNQWSFAQTSRRHYAICKENILIRSIKMIIPGSKSDAKNDRISDGLQKLQFDNAGDKIKRLDITLRIPYMLQGIRRELFSAALVCAKSLHTLSIKVGDRDVSINTIGKLYEFLESMNLTIQELEMQLQLNNAKSLDDRINQLQLPIKKFKLTLLIKNQHVYSPVTPAYHLDGLLELILHLSLSSTVLALEVGLQCDSLSVGNLNLKELSKHNLPTFAIDLKRCYRKSYAYAKAISKTWNNVECLSVAYSVPYKASQFEFALSEALVVFKGLYNCKRLFLDIHFGSVDKEDGDWYRARFEITELLGKALPSLEKVCWHVDDCYLYISFDVLRGYKNEVTAVPNRGGERWNEFKRFRDSLESDDFYDD